MVRLIVAPWRWVAGWPLWTAKRPILAYVLVVDAVALAAAGLTAQLMPVTRADLIRFVILASCGVIHLELSRRLERDRERASGNGPYLDGRTIWAFAAVLVLPPVLATAMVALTSAHSWLRIWSGSRPVLFQWWFGASTSLLGTQAAVMVLSVGPGPYPGVPHSVGALIAVLGAATLRWMINYGLVVAAILASRPETRGAQVLGNISEQLLEAGALAMGLVVAGLVVYEPILLIGAVVAILAIHRGVLSDQFHRSVRVDATTGLAAAEWWRQVADHELDRASHHKGTLGLILGDLDYAQAVRDRHGHHVADQVMKALAEAITTELRDEDTAGRFSVDTFAIALPGITPDALADVADRIRRRVKALEITSDPGGNHIRNLSMSLGTAHYPGAGGTLAELLMAADTAQLAAKNNGRGQVRHAPKAAD